ncbi:MAG: long-chain fatty acid--CoA ligase [Acidobacteria bacterium]|nr:long-chain fatty acid--CoA ligase [Acidobacteriota bacterium]
MGTDFKSLPDLFEASIARFSDNPLFGVKSDGSWHWLSYGEFGEQVAQARAGLAALGVAAGDRVAAITDNRVEWAVGAYGTYTLGAAWVPMYEAQQAKEWQYILADAGAKVAIVANDGIRAQLGDHAGELPDLEQIVVIDGEAGGGAITFSELLERGAEAPVDTVHPDPSSLAGLIYTSGTTGKPKGVMLSHANLTSNINTFPDLFDIGPDDRTASFLPWAHSFGQTVELHFIMAAGASAGLTSAQTLMEDLPEIRPTLLVSVPAVYNRIYDGLQKLMAAEGGVKKKIFDLAMANADKRAKLAAEGKTSRWVELQNGIYDRLVFSKVRDRFGGRLRYSITGGAAISPEVANFISALGMTVYEGYGLTETSPVSAANWPGTRRVGTVGKEIPGVRIEIDTDAIGSDDVGEIVIYGPNVMMGYYNLPGENEAVFTADRGFRTGDLGSRDEDGFISIRGRIKEQYKLENGKYVVPSPIEEQLQLSGYITNIMVYGEQRPHNVAVIVPDLEALNGWAEELGLGDRSVEQLLKETAVVDLIGRELNRQSGPIKGYERVRGFVLTDEEFTPENGMLTPSLKVKRRAVMAKYGDQIEALYSRES